jgi:hypothetical protein
LVLFHRTTHRTGACIAVSANQNIADDMMISRIGPIAAL